MLADWPPASEDTLGERLSITSLSSSASWPSQEVGTNPAKQRLSGCPQVLSPLLNQASYRSESLCYLPHNRTATANEKLPEFFLLPSYREEEAEARIRR